MTSQYSQLGPGPTWPPARRKSREKKKGEPELEIGEVKEREKWWGGEGVHYSLEGEVVKKEELGC